MATYMLIILMIMFPTLCASEVIHKGDSGRGLNLFKKPKIEMSSDYSGRLLGFPLTSSVWKVGRFNSKKFKISNLYSPFFIIGCDPISERWLNIRASELIKKKVFGLVVSCESEKQYADLIGNHKNIHFQLVENMDAYAKHINHNIYPVLIYGYGVEQ